MHHPRFNKPEEGASIADALVAIVLTSIMAGGVFILLSSNSGRLLTNLKQDRDLLRFVSLTIDLERRLALLYCDWWKQGIRYTEGEEGMELQAENGDQIDVFRIEIQDRAVELSGPLEEVVTAYRFETATPLIRPVFDEEGHFSSVQVTYSESLRALLYPQSRPLYSSEHFSGALQ